MTREEHLEFCKICQNRKMDFQQGLLCRLTNQKADFEETCPDYLKDELEEELLFKKKMAMAGEDGAEGDPMDYQKNKNNGCLLMFFGITISSFSLVAMESIGIGILFSGAIFGGFVLYMKGHEQEKIFNEHEEKKNK